MYGTEQHGLGLHSRPASGFGPGSASSSGPELVADLDLGYLLVLGGRAVQAATERAATGLDVSATDLNALYELRIHGPLLSGSFAHLLNVQQSTVTALADRLEAAGLLQRRRDDRDRRRIWLSITEQGQASVKEAYATVTIEVEAVFCRLAPGARTALKALLGDLIRPWLLERTPSST